MAKPETDEADAITRGSGNVFADLGYPDAEERQTKLRLAHALNQITARRRDLARQIHHGFIALIEAELQVLCATKSTWSTGARFC